MPKITVHGGASDITAPLLASAPVEPAVDALELQAAAEAPTTAPPPPTRRGATRRDRA